ncbi:hypothetical protein Tco_1180506 [Tanacetum coccineum]
MDFAALASAMNEIQKLKIQLEKLRLDSAGFLLTVKETGLQVASATNNLQLLTITAQPNTSFAEPSNEIF